MGVIRIALSNNLRLPLLPLFGRLFRELTSVLVVSTDRFASAAGKTSAAPIESDLLLFFAERLKVQLRDQGARHDLVDAVFARACLVLHRRRLRDVALGSEPTVMTAGARGGGGRSSIFPLPEPTPWVCPDSESGHS